MTGRLTAGALVLALWAMPLGAQPAKRALGPSPGVASSSPPADAAPEAPPQDASAAAPPRVRTLPDETLRAIQADPTYRYDDPVVASRSWREILGEAIQRLFDRMFRAVGPTGAWWIAVTLAVVAVGWALSRLLGADRGGLFGTRERRRAAVGDPLLDVEDIAGVDLASLLAEARADGDWRGALRLRYLLLLQTLAAAGAIGWARDKTNRTYAAEVRAWDAAHPGEPIAPAFAQATALFERVWYGGLAVSAPRFAALDADAAAAERALSRQPVPA